MKSLKYYAHATLSILALGIFATALMLAVTLFGFGGF